MTPPHVPDRNITRRLGALQVNPTVGAIFGALSDRIRSELGAEAAAVYIDIGDDNLWLLPQGNVASSDDACFDGSRWADSTRGIHVSQGAGVVGLVAIGAVPESAAKSPSAEPQQGCSTPGIRDAVEVLLLNGGMDAFDNGKPWKRCSCGRRVGYPRIQTIVPVVGPSGTCCLPGDVEEQ